MIWLLLFLLILVLLISYKLSGKDFFAPGSMMTVAFIISTISAIINLKRWKFSLGLESFLIVFLGVCITVLVNIVIHSELSKKYVKVLSANDSPLTTGVSCVLFALMIMITYYQLSFVRRVVGANSVFKLMYSYRLKTSYGTGVYNMPGYLTQLNHLSIAICQICGFNLVVFWKELKKSTLLINIATVIMWCLKIILNASRYEIFAFFIGIVYIFYMNRMRVNGGYKEYKIRSIVRLILLLGAVLVLFYIGADLVGRKSDATLIEYITAYSGEQIPNLDLFIKDNVNWANSFPGETFYSLIQWLRRRGVDSIPIVSIHKEFRTSNGYSMGNTYTAFRDYYHDFGLIGVFLFHTLFSVIFSYTYEKGKKRITNIGILIMSMFYACIPLYTFNNSFFGLYFSPSYFISIIELIILYYCFVSDRITGRMRVTFNGRKRTL